MSKTISPALLLHKSGSTTTLCGLLKVGPLLDGTFITCTSLDRDITYDDMSGDGPLVYRASTGFQESNFQATSDLGVDNAEAKTLIPVYPNPGITQLMIDRGDLDSIEFIVYQVNYRDLTMGHEIMAAGPIGEQKIERGGLITIELRSWSQLLKQKSVVSYYSLTCRSRLGLSTGPVRNRCNYDISGEWDDFAVTAVGTEVVREFTIIGTDSNGIVATDDYYAPGLVEFETGDNAGQQLEIESYAADGEISLLMTTRNPIQIGDTGRLRRSCTLRWSGHNSCQTYNNRQNFRGEPFIPIGDALALNVPGVAGGGLNNGTGEVEA